MNKQQTAVEWIEQEMLKGNLSLKEILIQAKEMEKEQIKEAYFIGGHQMKNNKYIGMHDYYNETYGGKK
jgi:uncharacterized protein YoaH (UPF0181 family)